MCMQIAAAVEDLHDITQMHVFRTRLYIRTQIRDLSNFCHLAKRNRNKLISLSPVWFHPLISAYNNNTFMLMHRNCFELNVKLGFYKSKILQCCDKRAEPLMNSPVPQSLRSITYTSYWSSNGWTPLILRNSPIGEFFSWLQTVLLHKGQIGQSSARVRTGLGDMNAEVYKSRSCNYT